MLDFALLGFVGLCLLACAWAKQTNQHGLVRCFWILPVRRGVWAISALKINGREPQPAQSQPMAGPRQPRAGPIHPRAAQCPPKASPTQPRAAQSQPRPLQHCRSESGRISPVSSIWHPCSFASVQLSSCGTLLWNLSNLTQECSYQPLFPSVFSHAS